MKKSTRGALLATATASLLAGCMQSTEDRINAAVPPSPELVAAKAAFDSAAEAMKADTDQLKVDYAAQLKIRALECSRGYEPGMFASKDTIRKDVGNEECFHNADAKLAQWLGLRRIGWLAAMPALRPIPAKPGNMLVAPDRIINAVFAANAGVALLQSESGYALVDLDGQQIRKGDKASTQAFSISDNGRLLLTGEDGELQVIDAEHGDVLTTVPDVRSRAFFVGDKGLAYTSKSDEITYRDFGTGTDSKVPMTGYLSGVVRTSPQAQRYLFLASGRAGWVELSPDGQGFKATLSNEAKLPAGSWDNQPQIGHGSLYFAGSNTLGRLPLGSMEPETVDFTPVNLSRVVPTADPDVVLVNAYGRGLGGNGSSTMNAYSFKQKTLAPLDTSTLLSARLVYVSPANRNAMIDGEKVVLLDKLPLGPAADAAETIHKVRFEQQLAELESMDRIQQLQSSQRSVYGATQPSSFRTSGLPTAGFPSSSPAGSSYGARASSAPSQHFSDGEAGLVEAMRAGVLRLGGPGDLDTWKMAYMSKNRRMPGKYFDERMQHQKVYVVTGAMTLPGNLFGAHSVVFVVGPGVPFPQGNPGHSPVLDIGSGQCSGVCMFGD